VPRDGISVEQAVKAPYLNRETGKPDPEDLKSRPGTRLLVGPRVGGGGGRRGTLGFEPPHAGMPG